MKKFRVLVRGENFLLASEGAVKRFGFYTTRFVEALDKDEAERRAVESLRQEDRLRGGVLNDPSDPPMLFAEEIDEISSFGRRRSIARARLLRGSADRALGGSQFIRCDHATWPERSRARTSDGRV